MALITSRLLVNEGTTAVDSIADLRALTETPDVVVVRGHTLPFDGGEGIFDLLAPNGGVPGDIDVAGHDDDGAHIVCPATTAVYGRRETQYTPQMFGVVAATDETAAAAASDQHERMSRWVDFVLDPHVFSGWAYRNNEVHAISGLVPDGLYRCESPLIIHISGTAPLQAGGVVGEIVMYGRVWTPLTIQTQGIILRGGRRAGKPRMVLRAVKQKQGSGRVKWDGDPWPDLYRDSTAYRAWAGTTAVYAGEEITQLLGSGATALYKVTVSGTTGGAAPTDVTGNTFANGSATLQYQGTIRNSLGQSCRDMLRKCRDIGIHIQDANEWHNLVCETEGYTVGVGLWPNDDSTYSVGFVNVDGNHYGCKFGAVCAHWIADQTVANQAAMLALTGLPQRYVVRRSDDVVNDWRFTGALGSEAVLGSWTPFARNSGNNWTNENYFQGGCNYYAYGTGSFIDSSRGIYGILFTSFEPQASNQVCSHTIHDGLAVEYAGKTSFGEMVNVLVDYGTDNIVTCRNDQEIHPAAHFLMHGSNTNEPTRNEVHVPRAGRWIQDRNWSKDTSNGKQNRVYQTGSDHYWSKQYTCESLFGDAVFSGKNRVYFKETSVFLYDAAKPTNYVETWDSVHTSGIIFHSDDLSWTIHQNRSPCVIVELPEDHRGHATIEFEALLSSTSGASFNACIAVFDPITGTYGNYSARPRVPLGGSAGFSHSIAGGIVPFMWHSSALSLPVQFSPEAWIRKMLIFFAGVRVMGFRVRVFDARCASIYSPSHGYHKLSTHVVQSAPERGIYRAPSRLLLEDQTAGNKWIYLNKTAGLTEYWATSDAVADIAVPVKYQWGHVGGTEIQEYDGSVWNTIATGVTAVEPSDWASEA